MLSDLSRAKNVRTRAVTPENFTAEKGKGGMAGEEGTAWSKAAYLGVGWKVSPYVVLQPGEVKTLADIHAMGAIKHIWCTDSTPGHRNLILRIYWDDSDTPSVECPLGDFFCSALYRDYAPVTSLAICVNPKRGFNSYFEMPFRTGFRVTLENLHTADVAFYYQIDFEEKEIPDDALYFHAFFRRTNPVPYKEPFTILDTVRGRGNYVGTYLFWGVNNNGWWGEGEVKFYLDGDTDFPTVCGTGTEDYFCGSYNFDIGGKYQEFTTPYSGLSKVFRPDGLYHSQTRFSLYRFHITDPVVFDKDIRVTVQDLGWRADGRYLPQQDDISAVAYFYLDKPAQTVPGLPDKDYLELI